MVWLLELVHIGKVIIKVTTALGHSSLKHEQCDTVKQFVSGHDVFISLPTGEEKELYTALILA